MADLRQQQRLAYLLKNRPNDPQVKQLQAAGVTVPTAGTPGAQAAPPIDERANQYASDIAAGGVSQPFNPTLDARPGSGDLIADRQRQEQDLQGYLGRDLDSEYAKAKQMMDQDLQNRGQPIDPKNPAYQESLKLLDDNFSRQRADIRAQALQFGGQEMDRTFGQGEQRRANQLNEQTTSYNTNLGGVSALSDIDLAYKQLAAQKKAQQQTYKLGQGQLGLQRQALAKRGGGGSSSAVAESPFVDG